MSAFAAAVLAAAATAAAPPPLEQIVAGKSATAVLAAWCADHRLPALRADRLEHGAISRNRLIVESCSMTQKCERVHHRKGDSTFSERALASGAAPDGQVLAALRSSPAQRVAHRRVRLACGARTLLVADNWYLPDRLSPAMNRRLETTSAPFGLVVRSLGFHRRTLNAIADRRRRLTVRAVLIDRRGTRFSYVVERYASLPQ